MKTVLNYNLEKDIPFKDIDFDSDEYCLEYIDVGEDDELKKYIKKYGFFYPPILLLEKSKYKPVQGKRYIQIYRSYSSYLPYGLVLRKPVHYSEFLKLVICLKRQICGFNSVEKAIALKKIHDLTEGIETEFLSLLDLPKNEASLHNFLLLATAPEQIKSAIVKRSLDISTAFEIFKFPCKDWEKMLHFILKIQLGTKKRNSVVTMIYEICQRDQKQASDLIEDEGLKRVFAQNIDPPHKGERVCAHFCRQRYPTIHEYNERFYEKLKEVGIRKSFHLIIPRDFEEWKFELIVPFSSVEDFKNKVEKMRVIGDKDSFRELMSMRF